MNDILDRYAELLNEVDDWFASCIRAHADSILCHKGCSSCCRGLFDITLMDALYLKRGIDCLPDSVQAMLHIKAKARLQELEASYSFKQPWILNQYSPERCDEIMPEDDATPCLLLSEQGQCLVYAFRPMTCRLNGIPLIDLNTGEDMSDEWCSLNFTAQDPHELIAIRHQFTDLFTQELLLFRELTGRIFGKKINELDTVIPAAVLLDLNTLVARSLSDFQHGA